MAVRSVLVGLLVDVEAQGVHSQPQLGAFLVLDAEIVHPVHLQVLSYLQVLHHGVLPGTTTQDRETESPPGDGTLPCVCVCVCVADLPQHSLVLLVPHLDPHLPFFLVQLVLLQNSGFVTEK